MAYKTTEEGGFNLEIVTGGTCTLYASEETSTDDNGLGYNTAQVIMGQSGYSPGVNSTVCQLDFYFAGVVGTVTDFNYLARIYIMSGTGLGGGNPTGTCISTNSVTGAAIAAASPGWVAFTGFACQLLAGTNYGVVVYRTPTTDFSTSHYVRLGARLLDGTLTGFLAKWQTDLSNYAEYSAQEVNVRIYTLQ